MTKLSEKEQECDVRTQERDDLSSSLSRLQEKFETESMGEEVSSSGLGFQRQNGYLLAAALPGIIFILFHNFLKTLI